ncbi:hypothetical protein Taro_050946 [Colocasia esculenta]|uniref:Uncharacterized protein n=1 Tax=Colocasia esculenta TaxID=4460 RepID=A0A843XFE2_COLES|nr:hypothetical protein [Colocasia esculenta]
MSSTTTAWFVGAVEALKDQGFCRWNHRTLRSLHQNAKTNLGSFFQARRVSASTGRSTEGSSQRAKQSEESLRTVMFLSCWGPN